MSAPAAGAPDLDGATLAAVAIAAYALSNLVHEGLGHGGACLLAGGVPVSLDAVSFSCDGSSAGASAGRIVAAGGTLANLVVAAVTALALRSARAGWPAYFLWLLLALSLLQATGYWLFSGVAGVGDWAVVTRDLAPGWAWRSLLAVAGLAGYLGATAVALRTLSRFLGEGPGRFRRALLLTAVPYVAGGLLYVAAGIPSAHGPGMVLVSAVPASFGGASALAWMAQLLRDPGTFPSTGEATPLPRSPAWIAAGAVAAVAFVLGLGPGIPR
jgi:hypothetical protein